MPQIQNLLEVAQELELICNDVKIFGDVHPQSIIDSHKLIVQGVVHENSTQFSKYATIHEHKGSIRCHEAKIDILSGGEVHASNVTIDNCISGKIYAQNVLIQNLESNVTIYASNSIVINQINGAHNTLCIDYKKVPITVSKIDLIQDDIKELIYLLKDAQKNNSLTLKDIQKEISRLEHELQDISNATMLAKIDIQEPLQSPNTICFQLNQNKICYTTQKKHYSTFYLEEKNKQILLHPTKEFINL